VLLVIVAYLQLTLLAGAILGREPAIDRLLAANLLIITAATGLAIAWLVGRGATRADLGLVAGDLRADAALAAVGLGLVLAPLLALAAALNALVPYDHPVVEFLTGRRDLPAVGLVVATAVVAAPIGEELFFRRVLQGWLEKVFADGQSPLAIVCSADRALHHPPRPVQRGQRRPAPGRAGPASSGGGRGLVRHPRGARPGASPSLKTALVPRFTSGHNPEIIRRLQDAAARHLRPVTDPTPWHPPAPAAGPADLPTSSPISRCGS